MMRKKREEEVREMRGLGVELWPCHVEREWCNIAGGGLPSSAFYNMLIICKMSMSTVRSQVCFTK